MSQFDQLRLQPDNTRLRLELAGLLGQSGTPRRQFIEDSVRLHSAPPYSQDRFIILAEIAKQFLAHSREWFGDVLSLVRRYKFDRGFLAGVEFSGDEYGLVRSLLQSEPVRAIQLVGDERGLLAALSTADKCDITTLELYDDGTQHSVSGISANGICSLFRLPILSHIDCVKLDGNSIFDCDIPPLLHALHSHRLRSLSLSDTEIGADGLGHLASSDHIDTLEQLSLARLTIKGKLVVARLPKLLTLDLSESLSDNAADFQTFAAWDLPSIRVVNLTGNQIDDAEDLAFWIGQHTQLRCVELSACGLSDQTIEAIAEIAPSSLQAFVVQSNAFTNKVIPHLGQIVSAAKLRYLDIAGNSLRLDLSALLAVGDISQLTRLNISYNQLASSSGRCTCESRLVELNLDGCGITDEVLDSLLQHLSFPHLVRLTLRGNMVSSAGIRRLLDSSSFPALRDFDISNNKFDDTDIELLTQSKGFFRIQAINISDNNLTDKSVRVLATHSELVMAECQRTQLSQVGLQFLHSRFASEQLRVSLTSYLPKTM